MIDLLFRHFQGCTPDSRLFHSKPARLSFALSELLLDCVEAYSAVQMAISSLRRQPRSFLSRADFQITVEDGYSSLGMGRSYTKRVPSAPATQILLKHHPKLETTIWLPPVWSKLLLSCVALGDSFGVLGVWPAAWTAAQRALCSENSPSRLPGFQGAKALRFRTF